MLFLVMNIYSPTVKLGERTFVNRLSTRVRSLIEAVGATYADQEQAFKNICSFADKYFEAEHDHLYLSMCEESDTEFVVETAVTGVMPLLFKIDCDKGEITIHVA